MKYLSTLFLISSLFIYNSCSNDNNDIVDPDPDPIPTPINKYETGVDLTTYSELKQNQINLEDEPYFVLGYGYDLTSQYAHPDGVKCKIIDISKIKEGYIGEGAYHNYSSMDIGSGNVRDIKKNILTDLIKTDLDEKFYKNAFKDMFITPFLADSTFKDLEYYYDFTSSYSSAYRCMIFDDIKESYLSDSFLSDVNTLEADSIIKKYGTHLLKGIVMGSKKNFYYRSSSPDNLLGRKLGAMKHVLGTSGELGIFTSSQEKVSTEKENLYVEYVGGLPKNAMMPSWIFDVTNYDKSIKYNFSETIYDRNNFVLIDFNHSNDTSLIPIYELITDNDKKELIKKAFEDYLSK